MAYSEDKIQAVWEKGRVIQDRDPTEWRQDQCGAWLNRHQYHSELEYGWRIENVEAGGGDVLDNLYPFHWKNTFDIENGKPKCLVTADRTDLAPGQHVDQPRNANV